MWLWAAFVAIGVSMLFHGTGKRDDGHFVGQWVAPLLLFGAHPD
jgi:IS1 family transposase